MIKVLSAGFYTTIQDLGRTGYGSTGVPVSGAMDEYSAKLGNYLLNNKENDAVVEIAFGGCKLLFEKDCIISITGANFSAKINENKITINTVLFVEKGSVLSFGKRVFGVRTYIAVSGGFQTEKVFGSRSFYKNVTRNFIVTKGINLPIVSVQKKIKNSFSSIKVNQKYFQSEIIECYQGPEFDLLSSEEQKLLLTKTFTISLDNNRMRYRLQEEIQNTIPPMLTSGVLPGTVQLTPSGKLIVLMRDCQVTGGYSRVLQLTDNAINKLAQKTTGDIFEFRIE